MDNIIGIIAGAIFICGLVALVMGIINKDLVMTILGAFVIAISGLILIGSLTAPESNDKFCLNINNTQQTVDSLEVNVINIFYWADGEQYKIPSQGVNIYFTEGECNVIH